MDKLELLALAKDFSVKKFDEDYEVKMEDDNLAAFIEERDKSITYYVTGCYNSSCDWIEIDEDNFKKLKSFCELMVK